MKTQKYHCEGCGLVSSVDYRDAEGVIAVIDKMDADHKDKSPECTKHVRDLRLGDGKENPA